MDNTLGKDATFFGVLPVSFLIDAAELGIFVNFVIEAIREWWRK